MIVALGFTNISEVVVKLKAWQVVVDILQEKVDSHEGAGRCSFSFDHQAESRGLLKIQTLGALNPNLA